MSEASNQETVQMIATIMGYLGFALDKIHHLSTVPGDFVDLLAYQDTRSEDWVQVHLSKEDTSLVTIFRNDRSTKRFWQSITEFETGIEAWIEQHR